MAILDMEQMSRNINYSEPNNFLKNPQLLELFNQLDTPLFVVNGTGRVLYVNFSCIELFHLDASPKEISIFSIINASDEKKFEHSLNAAKIKGSSRIEHIDLALPSPSESKIGLYIQQVHAGIDQYICTFQNKAIAANSKIDFSQLFLNISSNLQEGIFRINLHTGFVFVNNYFLKLFGLTSRKEVFAKEINKFFADKEQRDLLLKKLLNERTLRNESILILRPDGSTFWALVNCTLIYNKESGCYVDGALNDISHQKQSEKLLREKNIELKKINSQLDKFIYSASHDIRSPMTSIMGLVNILRMEIDESKHTFLDKIDTSLQKLDYFIKETLQFSENTKKRILSQKIDFQELVFLAWDKINGPNSNVQFDVDLSGSDYIFYSDYDRLLTILRNIFRNAVQFSDSSKRVKYVDVRVRIDITETEIVIFDNGIGIGKPYVKNVFDMFYRAHEHLSGPGMGLYIVKETLAKINGHITLKSEFREGTTISLKIPNDKKGLLMWRKRTLEA